ncbi:hypothetical protein OCU04_008207 [Sclerotinia nivalis]|uniref:Uncharacterized protein n=1 Tax=Sclerotinia nivalis TaxID=352851 RepID=A0A9X0AHL3_9HELO|nr:hypothetical protein OCU04_008207 [Sclerotinia nivalis]
MSRGLCTGTGMGMGISLRRKAEYLLASTFRGGNYGSLGMGMRFANSGFSLGLRSRARGFSTGSSSRSSSASGSSSPSSTFSTNTNGTTITASPFANKTILVTGASRGIGRAIAQRFGGDGGRMVLVGRNRVGLESLGVEIRKVREERDREALERGDYEIDEEGVGEEMVGGKGIGEDGIDIDIVCGDVGKREFWEEEFGRGKRADGHPKPKIDILINAAGLTHSSPLITTSPSLIENILQTNLMGTIWGCKIIGKDMLRRREGMLFYFLSSFLFLCSFSPPSENEGVFLGFLMMFEEGRFVGIFIIFQ